MTRGRAKRRPVVLYQPRDEGSVMPLGLLALGSWLAGEHVVIVDGRFELAPEARIVELARVALCLGVTVRTGAPAARGRARERGGACREPRASRSCGAEPTRRSTRRPAWRRAWSTPAPSAPARRRWPPPWRTCARGAASARGPGWPWRGRTAGPRDAAPAPATLWPRADYSLLDVERHFESRGARRLDYCSSRGARDGAGLDGDPRRARGGRGGAARRAVPALGDPLPGRGLLRRPGARGRDRAGPASTAAGALGWQAGARPQDVVASAPERLRLLARERLPQAPPGRGAGRAAARAPDGGGLAAARGRARGAVRLRRGGARSGRFDGIARRGRGGPVALCAGRALRDPDPSRVDAGAGPGGGPVARGLGAGRGGAVAGRPGGAAPGPRDLLLRGSAARPGPPPGQAPGAPPRPRARAARLLRASTSSASPSRRRRSCARAGSRRATRVD